MQDIKDKITRNAKTKKLISVEENAVAAKPSKIDVQNFYQLLQEQMKTASSEAVVDEIFNLRQ